MRPQKQILFATMAFILSLGADCFAAGPASGMPWEGPLQSGFDGGSWRFLF